jgi:hypothetical protein
MKLQRKVNKYEDTEAVWFDLGYDDIKLYSLTTIDAYRNPTARVITQEELDEFLKYW